MQSRRPLETAPGRPKAPLEGAPPSFDALSGPHLYRHLYRDAVLDAVPADGAVLCLETFPSFCNKFTSRSFVLTRTVRQKGPRLAGQGTRRACGVSRLFQAAFSVKNLPPEFWGQTRYDTCNSTLCGPRNDPRDFLFSEEGTKES
ncbi:hypothetical protein BGX16_1965 [Hallerella succinigenes]|uniref:Uncharacterized protein n=1 Tax=Hallerella succinigenes TaxID=1896222 RepID=A0A2M9A8B0_9BACT|nr:hypothetical protein BGX16_1965 [Hallerella succinigenes]